MTVDRGPSGIWELVREIPRGRVAGYGDVGRNLDGPVSGLLVGKWLARCPEGVPWWRVVGRDGDLLVGRKDPEAALTQERRLKSEGVSFVAGRVDMAAHRWEELV